MAVHQLPRRGVTAPLGAVVMTEFFFDLAGHQTSEPKPGGRIEWTFYADPEQEEILWSEHFDVLPPMG